MAKIGKCVTSTDPLLVVPDVLPIFAKIVNVK